LEIGVAGLGHGSPILCPTTRLSTLTGAGMAGDPLRRPYPPNDGWATVNHILPDHPQRIRVDAGASGANV
jgi:hypothetical protein